MLLCMDANSDRRDLRLAIGGYRLRFIPAYRRSIMTKARAGAVIFAAGLVAVAMALGLAIAFRPAGATAEPAMFPTAMAVVPSPVLYATVTPSPTPAWSPSLRPSEPPSGPSTAPVPALIAIDGADPTVTAAIQAAAGAVQQLDAYRFLVGMSGRSVLDLSADQHVDWATRGDLVRSPVLSIDAMFGYSLVEYDNSASAGSSSRLVMIGDDAWEFDRDGTARPVKGNIDSMSLLLPDDFVRRVFAPFAGAYERVGRERHNAVDATHYRATSEGLKAWLLAIDMEGSCTIDLWIADEGYLLAAETRCQPHNESAGRGFLAQLEITAANDPDISIKQPK